MLPLTPAKEITPAVPPSPPGEQQELAMAASLTFEKDVWIAGAAAATSTNWPVFSVPGTRCYLMEARCRYDVAGGANSTLDVRKLTEGAARGVGGSMLSSKFDLTAAARTVYQKTATTVLSAAVIDPTTGEAIELQSAGTLTNLDDLVVTLVFGVLPQDIPVSQSL